MHLYIKYIILLIICFFAIQCTYGQAYGYSFTNPKKKRIKIKFDKRNNLIIVPVRLNGKYDLNFLVDSGVRHLLLTKRHYTDSLGIKYGKEFEIFGADGQSSVTAMLASNLNIELPGLVGKRKAALVLKEDYFDFDRMIGTKIDGIIGMDLFLRFIVKINYEKQILYLHEPEKFKVPRSYKPFDLDTHKEKLYINVVSMSQMGVAKQTRLLIDTGASLYMMLDLINGTNPLLPRKVIKGNFSQILGGNMTTYIGRVSFLGFTPYAFRNVIVNFQPPLDIDGPRDTTFSRQGILGGGILSRFHVIIDAFKQKIYLKKNNRYGQPFTRDKSGIIFEEESATSKRIVVLQVVPESPAYYSGIQSGDIIVRCNSKKENKLNIDNLTYMLQAQTNALIKLDILRDGELIRINFRLEELI